MQTDCHFTRVINKYLSDFMQVQDVKIPRCLVATDKQLYFQKHFKRKGRKMEEVALVLIGFTLSVFPILFNQLSATHHFRDENFFLTFFLRSYILESILISFRNQDQEKNSSLDSSKNLPNLFSHFFYFYVLDLNSNSKYV